MIEVSNLTKRYGRQTAVDGISFRVEKGEILGFLGPNGDRKSTRLNSSHPQQSRMPSSA